MSVDTITLGKFVATIHHDNDGESPRTAWDNVGTMIIRGNRYNLGDENQTADMDDCDSWDGVEKLIRKEYGKDCVLLPIYIYDHSGISISHTPFSCRWDSGRVGTIVVSRKKAREEYGMKRITKTNLQKVVTYLEGEIETLNQYLTGDVYGFTITDGENDEENIDSCWGFYGLEYTKQEVNQILKNLHEEQLKQEGEQQELNLVA